MATNTVKTMPIDEKVRIIESKIATLTDFGPAFVHQHLGPEFESELRYRLSLGCEPVPADMPAAGRYEIAYGNWIWLSLVCYGFIREKMGERGLELYEEAETRALIDQNQNKTITALTLFRFIDRPRAFRMAARTLVYQLQWLTPLHAVELLDQRAIIHIPTCKILAYPGSHDLCQLGCQQVIVQWFARQYQLKLSFARRGNGCTCTATPL